MSGFLITLSLVNFMQKVFALQIRSITHISLRKQREVFAKQSNLTWRQTSGLILPETWVVSEYPICILYCEIFFHAIFWLTRVKRKMPISRISQKCLNFSCGKYLTLCLNYWRLKGGKWKCAIQLKPSTQEMKSHASLVSGSQPETSDYFHLDLVTLLL